MEGRQKLIDAYKLAGDLDSLSEELDCQRVHLITYLGGVVPVPPGLLKRTMAFIERKEAEIKAQR